MSAANRTEGGGWKLLRLALLATLLLSLSGVARAQAASWPQFGVSQSFRDFGYNGDANSYDPTHDVTTSPLWGPLNVTRLRAIVPWDIAGRPLNDPRRLEFQHWLDRVNQLHAQPYVVFGPTEEKSSTDQIHNPPDWKNVQTRIPNPALNVSSKGGLPQDSSKEAFVAPPVDQYRAAIADFFATWGPKTAGHVEVVGAWNEPNDPKPNVGLPGGMTGPVFLPGGSVEMTAVECPNGNGKGWSFYCGRCPSGASASNCGPLEAALLWTAAVRDAVVACGGFGVGHCEVVAGEFDSSPAPTTSSATWKYWNTYGAKLRSVSGLSPDIVSFHAHYDAEPLGTHDGKSAHHDCTPTNPDWCVTSTFRKWLNGFNAWSGPPALWNTETGVAHDPGSFSKSPEMEQQHRLNQLIALSNENHVSRLYYFNFQTHGGEDRGLVDQGPNVNTRARAVWKSVSCRPGLSCQAPPAPPAPSGPRWHDLNGDGRADIVAVEEDPAGGMRYVTGLPDASGTSFAWNVTNLGHMSVAGRGAVGDLNGDGKGDIVGLEPDPAGGVRYMVGLGDGSGRGFSWQGTNLTKMTQPRAVAVGDVNGDGHDDIVAIEPDPAGGVRYLTGLGNGSGTSFAWNLTNLNKMTPATALSVGDVNNDGRDDIVAAEPDEGNGTRYLTGISTGSGTSFTWNLTNLRHMTVPTSTTVGDVNGDGNVDIVSVEPDTGGGVRYLTGISDGSGRFFAWNLTNLRNMTVAPATAAGDINGDGKADIVSIEPDTGGGDRYVTGISNGTGTGFVWHLTNLRNMSLPVLRPYLVG
jgi:hypothetical protein